MKNKKENFQKNGSFIVSIVKTLSFFPSESNVSFLSLFLYILYHIGRTDEAGKSLNTGIHRMKGLEALFELPNKEVPVKIGKRTFYEKYSCC